MRVGRIAAGVLVVAGVATLSYAVTSSATASHGRSTPQPVQSQVRLGYVESGDGLATLRRNLAGVTSVGVDGLNLTETGAAVSRPDAGATAMLTAAHQAGKKALLLVGNYSSKINDFDPAIAHRLFASARNRAAVASALAADTHQGWDGIQLDLESLHGSDLAGLSAFTAELRAALPSDKTLGMAVMASTTTQEYRADAYDLPALAKSVDQIVLMAYDQHGPTWTSAGPVGGLPWAEQAMATMLRAVPRDKAVFGVAGYGYTWPTHGTGVQLSDAAARRAAVQPEWDARQGEWHSTLLHGGSVWWSDARSLKLREAVARDLHLQGIAVWSLALSDTVHA